MSLPRILIIAGSDSSGGAGIQADIKTITSLGGYAATAITAITAQNTKEVSSIHQVPSSIIKEQIEMVLSDIGADIIKIGMLLNEEVINAVAETLEKHPDIPVIVDPVMVSSTGSKLLEDEAIKALKDRLIEKSYLLTPNIDEAQILSGIEINTLEDMSEAAKTISNKAVLVKGGHMGGDKVQDVLAINGDLKTWESKRINTTDTHGTGCTLASAISFFLASGLELEEAIEKSRSYVLEAIKNAPKLGQGTGPLNHMNAA